MLNGRINGAKYIEFLSVGPRHLPLAAILKISVTVDRCVVTVSDGSFQNDLVGH